MHPNKCQKLYYNINEQNNYTIQDLSYVTGTLTHLLVYAIMGGLGGFHGPIYSFKFTQNYNIPKYVCMRSAFFNIYLIWEKYEMS